MKFRIINKLDAWLVPHWRTAYKWFSVQAMALDAAFLMTWATLPDDIKAGLPSWVVPVFSSMLLVVGIVGRMTSQPAVIPPSAPTEIGH